MNAQDLARYWRRRPFVPFRLVLDDERTMDIQHPQLMMVCKEDVVVGIQASDAPAFVCEEVLTFPLSSIRKIEPIPTSASA
jgi:hypothetical protein